jgi:hypothetical protein
VPTLVLYRSQPEHPEDDAVALDVAARIPSARGMRVSGNDYFNIFLSLDVVVRGGGLRGRARPRPVNGSHDRSRRRRESQRPAAGDLVP